MVDGELSARDRALLDFERGWWQRSTGTKAAAIRRHLRLSPARYYELLDLLCDSSSAMAYDPLVVRRLRLRRAGRRAARILGGTTPGSTGRR